MTNDAQVLRKFLSSHGLVCLKTIMNIYNRTDVSLCGQVKLLQFSCDNKAVCILDKLPITNRNAIVDSKIEDYVKRLSDSTEMHTSAVSIEVIACKIYFYNISF